MTDTDLFRAIMDEQGISYQKEDKPTYRSTWFDVGISGEVFCVEFREPLDGIPGTLGAHKELSFITEHDVSAEDAARVVCEVMDE